MTEKVVKKKSSDLIQIDCLNCGTSVQGDFCHECGQHVRDNTDRSLGRLLVEFFGNIFFLDNRFFLSIWYLVRFPGRMTVEFLDGKRRKFISPITLFLFLNLIYFFVNPLSDYSLTLQDQIYSQPYSDLIKESVHLKLQKEGLDEQSYGIIYQNASDNIAKSIMILNVPIIAIFILLMAFKKRPFYFDSLIFSFHFFSLFMISWVMLDGMDRLINFLVGHSDSTAAAISFNLFVFVLPLSFAIMGTKKFMNIRWYWAIPVGAGAMLAVFVANMFYRFIIFFLAFWST